LGKPAGREPCGGGRAECSGQLFLNANNGEPLCQAPFSQVAFNLTATSEAVIYLAMTRLLLRRLTRP
jgi:hypothetical protein